MSAWRVLVAAACIAAATPAAAAPAREGEAPSGARPDGSTEIRSDDNAAQRRVRWQLSIDAADDVETLLRTHLDLARYAELAEREPVSLGELSRLVETAPGQIRALLQTAGYFRPERVDVIAKSPDAGGLAEVQIVVRRGRATRVERVRLVFEGPLSVAAEAGDAPAGELIAAVNRAWSPAKGQVYNQDAWTEAKNAAVGLLRARGYTAAVLSGSSARVDPERDAADLFVVVDSGALARFGAVRFEGLQHIREADLRSLIPFQPSDPLLEQTLLDFQDRLVKTTLFDAVAVSIEADDAAAPAPVLVRVRERAMHQVTIGVGVSETSGPRVTFEHLHQQVLGLPWQAKTKLQLGRSEQGASLDLLSHPRPGAYRDLLAGSVVRTEAGDLAVTSLKGRIGRTQDTERIDRLVYIEGLRDQTRSLDGNTPSDTIGAVTGNINWVWRDLDHPVLPTQGLALSAELGAGRSFDDGGTGGWFARTLGRATGYWTFGQQWYGQARLQAGQVFARSATTIPYTLLFRAGGDESVRGYDYQALGPTSAAGDALGGHVLAAGSLEVARPVSARLPSVWGAVFIDAGDAATGWSALRPKLGAGVGVRWRSPVGALKLDLAYGEAVRRWRLHFTVGVVF